MIRELQKADINKVADIWLDTNVVTHYFISKQYWQNNFELVKELLLQQLSMSMRIIKKCRDL